MTWVFVLADIFAFSIEILFINYFYKIFGEKNCNTKWVFVIVNFVYVALMTLINYFNHYGIYLLLYFSSILILLIGYSFLYKMKVSRRIYSILIIYAIIIASKFLTCCLLSFITTLSFTEILKTDYLYVLTVIFSEIVIFALIKLLSAFIVCKKQSFPKGVKIAFIIMPITSLAVICLFVEYVYDRVGQILAFILSLLLIISNIVVMSIINFVAKQKDKEKAIEARAQQLEYERQYYSDLYDKQLVADKVTHDLKNKFFAIASLLKESPQEVNKELDGIATIFNDVSVLKLTGNVGIDSLLNNKISLAKNNNIDVNINCFIAEIDNKYIIDLCVVLGNLLDNSIEACIKIEDVSKRYININLKQELQHLKITIENSYIKENIEEGTSKKDKQHHGFGLQNIKDIIEKSNGYFITNQDDEKFTTIVGMDVIGNN